jgi:hypothetical protein
MSLSPPNSVDSTPLPISIFGGFMSISGMEFVPKGKEILDLFLMSKRNKFQAKLLPPSLRKFSGRPASQITHILLFLRLILKPDKYRCHAALASVEKSRIASMVKVKS